MNTAICICNEHMKVERKKNDKSLVFVSSEMNFRYKSQACLGLALLCFAVAFASAVSSPKKKKLIFIHTYADEWSKKKTKLYPIRNPYKM